MGNEVNYSMKEIQLTHYTQASLVAKMNMRAMSLCLHCCNPLCSNSKNNRSIPENFRGTELLVKILIFKLQQIGGGSHAPRVRCI